MKTKKLKILEVAIATIILIIMLIFFIKEIGWYTVFTSIAIDIVYNDIKNFIKEINKNSTM